MLESDVQRLLELRRGGELGGQQAVLHRDLQRVEDKKKMKKKGARGTKRPRPVTASSGRILSTSSCSSSAWLLVG
jgi:hypothetical protein